MFEAESFRECSGGGGAGRGIRWVQIRCCALTSGNIKKDINI